jgi:hypothetical protein
MYVCATSDHNLYVISGFIAGSMRYVARQTFCIKGSKIHCQYRWRNFCSALENSIHGHQTKSNSYETSFRKIYHLLTPNRAYFCPVKCTVTHPYITLQSVTLAATGLECRALASVPPCQECTDVSTVSLLSNQ